MVSVFISMCLSSLTPICILLHKQPIHVFPNGKHLSLIITRINITSIVQLTTTLLNIKFQLIKMIYALRVHVFITPTQSWKHRVIGIHIPTILDHVIKSQFEFARVFKSRIMPRQLMTHYMIVIQHNGIVIRRWGYKFSTFASINILNQTELTRA